MILDFQSARTGNYELLVCGFLGKYTYKVMWHTETAMTVVGAGSEEYTDVYDARYAAVLHLANILPKAQSERLIASQAELTWEPYPPGVPFRL